MQPMTSSLMARTVLSILVAMTLIACESYNDPAPTSGAARVKKLNTSGNTT